MTQSSGMTPATPAGLEREVDAIRQRFETLQRQQAAGRMTNLLAMIVILVLFGIFAYALYGKYRAEFADQEQLKAVFADELQKLTPEVQRHMTEALQTAGPRFQQVAVERLQAVGPDIATAFRQEFQNLPKEAGDEMAAKLQQVIDRVSKQVEPDLRKRFPTLTEERIAAMLTEFRDTHVRAQTERLMTKIQQDTIAEGSRIQSILDKFKAPAYEGQDANEMKVRFVATMLDYVKYLLVYGGQAGQEHREQLFPAFAPVITAPATQAAAAG